MHARDFCFWLQGAFELNDMKDGTLVFSLAQCQAIKSHLAMVFKHEIDPSMGPPLHQAALNVLHNPQQAAANALANFGRQDPTTGAIMRC